jgi:hypothetical protein
MVQFFYHIQAGVDLRGIPQGVEYAAFKETPAHTRAGMIHYFEEGKTVFAVLQVMYQFKVALGGFVNTDKFRICIHSNSAYMGDKGFGSIVEVIQESSCGNYFGRVFIKPETFKACGTELPVKPFPASFFVKKPVGPAVYY